MRSGGHPSTLNGSRVRILTTDATTRAMEKIGRPIGNTALMGAFAAATGLMSLDTTKDVIQKHFGPLGAGNSALAEFTYREIEGQMGGQLWQ